MHQYQKKFARDCEVTPYVEAQWELFGEKQERRLEAIKSLSKERKLEAVEKRARERFEQNKPVRGRPESTKGFYTCKYCFLHDLDGLARLKAHWKETHHSQPQTLKCLLVRSNLLKLNVNQFKSVQFPTNFTFWVSKKTETGD